MKTLLRHLIPNLDTHLTDDQLASHICGELSFVQQWIAQNHVKKCSQCKLRKEDLEGRRADRIVEQYQAGRVREQVSKKTKMEFSRKLQLQIKDFTPQEERSVRFPRMAFPEFPPMNPAFVTCMVFGFATILSFCFWWQQRTPHLSSNALLVRAERWDASSFASTPGVLCQTVQITVTKEAKKEIVSRSIYRDTQGRRKPKQVQLDRTSEEVRGRLTEAGLDWNEPLSAASYQNWHDRQRIREDHISRAGSHLLRLTTTVPDGLVAEQSLTVRDTDFHPVERIVSLRDNSTVEIAELDFNILPWSAVDTGLFEPMGFAGASSPGVPARVLQFPRLPETLSEGQLDEAELAARLMLNQLHADAGEQLEVRRTPQGITVEGIVSTNDRKRELTARLYMVPHVTTAIQSEADVIAHPASNDMVQTIATASMPEQLSPLQAYLKPQGKGVSEINDLAQRLFQNALAISQESKDITDLQSRFSDGERTVIATATLNELIYSHHGRLEAALRRERQLLTEVRNTAGSNQTPGGPHAASLTGAADRNLALARELTQTHHPATRSADKIVAEMSLALNDLVVGVHEAYGKSQSDTALGGKK